MNKKPWGTLDTFFVIIASIVFVFWMSGCAKPKPCPPPPPPVPCDSCCPECPECPECPACDSCCPECPECPAWECPEGWECKEIPDPGEIPGPGPEVYIQIDRAISLADTLANSDNQGFNWNAGVIDTAHVLRHCPWGLSDGQDPWFDMSTSEMEAHRATSKDWDRRVKLLIRDLPIVNKRCDPEHEQHHEVYCTQSNVRKTRMEEFKAGWEPHLAVHEALRARGQEDPIRETCAFDSIKGWCQCRNQ